MSRQFEQLKDTAKNLDRAYKGAKKDNSAEARLERIEALLLFLIDAIAELPSDEVVKKI